MTAPATTDLTAPSAADASARPYAVRPARVGLQLQPQQADYAAIRRTVAAAEEIGVDIVFNWDHFFPLYGDPDGKHFECWTMLGAWAEATERVEIGALGDLQQLPQPRTARRHGPHGRPHQRGRLILGIGSGWFEKDYDEYGYEFGTAGGGSTHSARRCRGSSSGSAKLNPGPDPRHPRPDRRRRRAEDAAPRRQARRHLARLRRARDRRPQARRPRRVVRARSAATRARSSAPPAYPGTRSSSEPGAVRRRDAPVHRRDRRTGLRPRAAP